MNRASSLRRLIASHFLLVLPWSTSCSLVQILHLRRLTLSVDAAQVNLKLYKGQTHTSPLIENPMAVSSWQYKSHSCKHMACFARTYTSVSCSGERHAWFGMDTY